MTLDGPLPMGMMISRAGVLVSTVNLQVDLVPNHNNHLLLRAIVLRAVLVPSVVVVLVATSRDAVVVPRGLGKNRIPINTKDHRNVLERPMDHLGTKKKVRFTVF